MTPVLESAHMRLTKSQKQSIGPLIGAYRNVSGASLFGSQAHGITGPMSDIDLAIDFVPNASAAQRQKIMNRLFSDLSRLLKTDHIDLIDLTNAPVLLRYNALTKGTPLAVRHPDAFERTRFRAVQDYEDFRYHLETQTRLIKHKIATYVTH